MKTRALASFSAIASLAVVFGACGRDRPVTSPTDTPYGSQVSTIGDSAVDVPESHVGLSSSPLSFASDDAALEDAVRSAGGIALIVIKSPNAARMSSAGGTRARVAASDVRSALQMMAQRPDVQVLDFYRMLGIVRARLGSGAATNLRWNSSIDVIEPATAEAAASGSVTSYPTFRASRVIGADASGQITPWNVSEVQAPSAWAYSTGASTKVMLSFRGLAYTDPDFPTIPSGNCGGYVHACGGALYISGTEIFGVMAAQNNSFGLVGVAPGLQGSNIYLWNPYMHFNPDTVDISMIIAGVNTAIQNGVRVLYTDVIHSNYFPAEAAAYASAYTAGVTVVAPMGGRGVYASQQYPGSFPHVINVSGVDPSGAFAGAGTCDANYWASGSDYGPLVTLAAPISAYATYGNGYYYDDWYTWPPHICSPDLAASHVAAVAALLQDRHPTWTPSQILAQLQASASGGGTRIDDRYGYGLVNAYAAVSPPPPPSLNNYIYAQAPYYYAEPSGGSTPYSYLWEVCLRLCGGGGGNAPAVSGGVNPNLPVGGFQFLSNATWVYWTSSGSILRSTVTDANNQQAVAYYTTP